MYLGSVEKYFIPIKSNAFIYKWCTFCYDPLLKKPCLDHKIIIGKRLIISILSCSHLLTFDHCQSVSLPVLPQGKIIGVINQLTCI